MGAFNYGAVEAGCRRTVGASDQLFNQKASEVGGQKLQKVEEDKTLCHSQCKHTHDIAESFAVVAGFWCHSRGVDELSNFSATTKHQD